jgi:hypothetical protein
MIGRLEKGRPIDHVETGGIGIFVTIEEEALLPRGPRGQQCEKSVFHWAAESISITTEFIDCALTTIEFENNPIGLLPNGRSRTYFWHSC